MIPSLEVIDNFDKKGSEVESTIYEDEEIDFEEIEDNEDEEIEGDEEEEEENEEEEVASKGK